MLGGFLGLMPIGRLKPGIALSKQNVGYIAVNLFFKQHLHVLFGVKAGVGRKFCLLKDIPLSTDRFKILPRPLNHRL